MSDDRIESKEKHTFRSAVKWAYAMNSGEKAINALFTFALAYILGPKDFGLLAIALVYIAFIQMFLDQGLSAALIQRADLVQEHLDTVFWTNLVVSVLLMFVTIFAGHWGARANGLPQLELIIMSLSVCLPIEGLAMVQTSILKRHMDFKALALRSSGSVLLGGAVGLAMALAGFGVWSLVAQQIARDLSALVLLWSVSGWRPRLHFSWTHLKQLLGFSTANFMAKMGVFANNQFDSLILGFFFGPTAVGLYRLADRMMGTLLDAMTSSVQAVSFPQFSRFQNDPASLKRSVLSCVWMGSFLTIPMLVGLGLTSGQVMSVMGPKWEPASSVLKVLCAVGVAGVFGPYTGPLLQALSRPRLLAILHWIFTAVWVVVLGFTVFATEHSQVSVQIMSVSLARLFIAAGISTPIMLILLMKLSRVSPRELLGAAGPGLLSGIATMVTVLGIQYSGLLSHVSVYFALLCEVVAGGVVTIGTLLMVDSNARQALRTVIPSSVPLPAQFGDA
jgi:O-antigen/teichoic acid export membrane protein